jgi:replicative DNA helicase
LFAAERGGVFVPDEVMANRDAEAALLGSMLQDAEVADAVIAKMTEDSFFYDSHRLVFKAIQTLRMQASAVDLVTITEALRTGGALELVGGASYISVLGNAVPTADNWEHYLRIVEENAILREIVKGAEEAKQQAQTKKSSGGGGTPSAYVSRGR